MMDNMTWEEKALAVNMFEGDFGLSSDRTLRDKIVTARKGGCCDYCLGEVQPKTKIRTAVHVFDGQLMSYRWCHDCVDAMARSWDHEDEDKDDPLQERFNLRYER